MIKYCLDNAMGTQCMKTSANKYTCAVPRSQQPERPQLPPQQPQQMRPPHAQPGAVPFSGVSSSYSAATMPNFFKDGQITQPAATHPKLLLIGDSLTAGWTGGGKGPFHPYGRTLSTYFKNALVVVNGVSGSRMKQYVEDPTVNVGGAVGQRVDTLLQTYALDSHDAVVIMGGTNDLGYGYPPEAICGYLTTLHQMCFSKGVRTVAVGVPPAGSSNSKRDQVNQCLRNMCQQHAGQCTSVDSEFMKQYLDPIDNLHFLPQGYDALALKLKDVVGSLLK